LLRKERVKNKFLSQRLKRYQKKMEVLVDVVDDTKIKDESLVESQRRAVDTVDREDREARQAAHGE
jgi:hypothetical protein